MFFPRFCLLLLAALLPLQAAAAEQGLFEFERIVVDQEVAARDAAVASGLAEVLVRVTGDRQIPGTAAGKALLAKAPRLLLQFDYFRRPPILPPQPLPTPGLPLSGAAPAESVSATPIKEETVLRGRFDAVVITRELNQAGLPIWGRERPPVTMALLLREGGVKPLDVAEIPVEWFAVNEIGRQRGLHFDKLAEPMTDGGQVLWEAEPEKLATVLRVLPGQVLLRGRITHVGDTWGAGWTLIQDGRAIQEWEHYAATLAETLTMAAHQAVDALASRYAIRATPGQQNYIGLRVSGVSSLADYARVQKYLQQLDAAESAELMSVNGDAVVYRLRVRGDAAVLSRALQLGNVLAPEPDQPGVADSGWSGEFRLGYRLLPLPTSPSSVPIPSGSATSPAAPASTPAAVPAAQQVKAP